MHKKILIVEDDPVMVAFLDEYLSSEFETKAMSDASKALEALPSLGASLVILDLFMPGMDGFGFLERARSVRDFDRLPILVLSSSNKSEDRVRALEAGADDFVIKPFNPQELAARIKNLIRRSG